MLHLFRTLQRVPSFNVAWVRTNIVQTIKIQRIDDQLRFILPLPNKEKCIFPLYPNETISELIIDIQAEDREKANIQIKDKRGVPIANSTLVSDLIKSIPFIISIDNNNKKEEFLIDQSDPIKAPDPGSLDLVDMFKKTLFQKIKSRILEDENRQHISLGEYLSICDGYGFTTEESMDYLHALHISGTVLYFPDNEHLKDYIFLKPAHITSSLGITLQLKLTKREVPILNAELEKLLPEYLPINKRKKELDIIAKKKARWFLGLGLGYLTIQSSILAHMVWIDFNWGIMEPVTYFVFLSTLIGGYFFFLISNEEYTYQALELRQINKSLRKLYTDKNHPFNWKKWNDLHLKVMALKEVIGEDNLSTEIKKAGI